MIKPIEIKIFKHVLIGEKNRTPAKYIDDDNNNNCELPHVLRTT